MRPASGSGGGPRRRAAGAGDRHPLEAVAVSRELIAQNLQEIGRADGKAAVLLALAGTLLGLLLMRRPTGIPWALAPWWAATVTTTGACLFLLLALLPRRSPAPTRRPCQPPTPARPVRRGGRRGEEGGGADDPGEDEERVLAYYEDVMRAAARAELWASLHRSGAAPRPQALRALTGTSRIARVKNQWVRCAVWCLLHAVPVAFPALVVGG